MKTQRFTRPLPRSIAVILAAATILVALIATADPGIQVSLVSTNQIQITVTNPVSGEIYGLYRRIQLQSPYEWTLHTVGTNGQTSFIIDRSVNTLGYFQVITGNDWDGDGVPNTSDAGLSNTNIGVLTITIQSPIHGSTLY